MRIERVRTRLFEGAKVSVPNRSEAVHARSNDGRSWVLKRSMSPESVCAEAIGYLLCRELQIDIPDAVAVLVGDPSAGAWTWASGFTQLVHWDAAPVEMITNPELFGALVVLDVWLGNEDRHEQNLVVRQTEIADELAFMAIDFDSSWVGSSQERAANRDVAPRLYPIVPPPAELWRNDLNGWLARVAQINQSELREFAVEACELAGDNAADDVLDWLLARRSKLPEFLDAAVNLLLEVPS